MKVYFSVLLMVLATGEAVPSDYYNLDKVPSLYKNYNTMDYNVQNPNVEALLKQYEMLNSPMRVNLDKIDQLPTYYGLDKMNDQMSSLYQKYNTMDYNVQNPNVQALLKQYEMLNSPMSVKLDKIDQLPTYYGLNKLNDQVSSLYQKYNMMDYNVQNPNVDVLLKEYEMINSPMSVKLEKIDQLPTYYGLDKLNDQVSALYQNYNTMDYNVQNPNVEALMKQYEILNSPMNINLNKINHVPTYYGLNKFNDQVASLYKKYSTMDYNLQNQNVEALLKQYEILKSPMNVNLNKMDQVPTYYGLNKLNDDVSSLYQKYNAMDYNVQNPNVEALLKEYEALNNQMAVNVGKADQVPTYYGLNKLNDYYDEDTVRLPSLGGRRY